MHHYVVKHNFGFIFFFFFIYVWNGEYCRDHRFNGNILHWEMKHCIKNIPFCQFYTVVGYAVTLPIQLILVADQISSL